MADRPLIMSGLMVRALLDGRKTQTRRISEKQDWPEAVRRWPHQKSCVPCAVGDRLWVREAWQAHSTFNHLPPRDIPPSRIFYQADRRYEPSGSRGRASIHMPRWASRLTLLVIDVRVERLQDISEEDAVAEGCPGSLGPNPDFPDEWDPTPVEEYRDLWNHIHGAGAWDANPWVAAITFEVDPRS